VYPRRTAIEEGGVLNAQIQSALPDLAPLAENLVRYGTVNGLDY
jgi:hypothetical protein